MYFEAINMTWMEHITVMEQLSKEVDINTSGSYRCIVLLALKNTIYSVCSGEK